MVFLSQKLRERKRFQCKKGIPRKQKLSIPLTLLASPDRSLPENNALPNLQEQKREHCLCVVLVLFKRAPLQDSHS